MISILLTIIVVGVLLWLVNKLPMQHTVKQILNIVVIIILVVWLLKVFNLFHYLNNIHL